MKKTELKNYLILTIIILVTLIITFYILSWYKQYNDTKLKTPIISDVLTEVSYEDINTIKKERNFLLVYACYTAEDKCRNFENKFKSYVKENDLSDSMVYLKLGEKYVNNSRLQDFYLKNKSADLSTSKLGYPTIMVFVDGKIVNVLRINKNEKITISMVEEFLSGYEL